MFEQENALPCAEPHFSIDNRHSLAGACQDHADVRRHVVAAFRIVREIIRILRHEAVEKFLQIATSGRIRVFHDDNAATRVLDENGYCSRLQSRPVNLRLHFVCDFVKTLAVGPEFKLVVVDAHWRTPYFGVTARAKPAIAQGYGGQTSSDGLGMRVKSSACVSLAYSGKAQARRMRYLQMRGDIERVLFDEAAIHKRLDEMAAQISSDYRDRQLMVIAVLAGSLIFTSDLLRRILLPLRLECLAVVSYHGKAQTSGEVTFKQVGLPDVADRDVLVVDDILDTGHTLAAVRERLATAKPCSIRVCVLLSKRKQRARDVDPDYVGFEIEDEFVVGYGLDFMERYRNLPYLGVLRKELLEPMS